MQVVETLIRLRPAAAGLRCDKEWRLRSDRPESGEHENSESDELSYVGRLRPVGVSIGYETADPYPHGRGAFHNVIQ